jgi:hypothetical protein
MQPSVRDVTFDSRFARDIDTPVRFFSLRSL